MVGQDERNFFTEAPVGRIAATKKPVEKPHYHGHRERLRHCFAETGNDALSDYELLELFLFRAIPAPTPTPRR